MIGSMGERGNARASAGAQLCQTADITEQMRARGIFSAELLALKRGFEDRGEYLLTRRSELENRFRRRAPTIEVIEELDEITLRVRPMQEVLWRDEFSNTVLTAGKNLALDTFLAGSSYTVVGPYMGLISSVSWSATAAADTMASHGGWLEAGITNAPTYSGGRKTAAWSAASAGSKALSAALGFTFTGAGTVKGCFLVYGTGAVSTVDNTSGTGMSAGVFTGGDQVVVSTNVLNCSYSLAF